MKLDVYFLFRLMTMAFARYEQIKEQSVIGMKYFIDSKPKLEFDIEIGPSIFAGIYFKIKYFLTFFIAVCQGGEFSHSKSTLLLQHGTFSFRTEENAPKEAFELVSDIRPKDKKWELIEKSYTNFEMNLEGNHRKIFFRLSPNCF